MSRASSPLHIIALSSASPDSSPVVAAVDLGAIRHNAQKLQACADGADLMAIIKADAYGHGMLPVARALTTAGIRHFGVARLAEGIRLREHGHTARILVLGAPAPAQLPQYAEYDLDATVPSPAVAAAVAKHAETGAPLRVQVLVDTGMGRLGLAPEAASEVLRRLRTTPGVTVAGLWTHFATADEPDSAFAQTQLERFEAVAAKHADDVQHIHAANTGALLTLGPAPASVSPTLVRSGIALYGLAATPELAAQLDLRPAMQLTARVTQLKTVPADTPISYGATWTAPHRTRIATLGVGYGDGYPRLGSGRASVRIRGYTRPVVGTICMDMCMVDLGPPDRAPATHVSRGDPAVLFGPSGPSVYEVARWSETIPYEICCKVSPRVPRRYTAARPPSEAPVVSPSEQHTTSLRLQDSPH